MFEKVLPDSNNSKNHLDELRRTDLVSDDRYYTTAEVAEKYGMSTANVGVIVKARNLTKVKVGVRNLLLKEEIDGVMAERMAQFGSYIIACLSNINQLKRVKLHA